MEKITVGMKIKLIKELDDRIPVGSIATIVYTDEFDQIFIDWIDCGQYKLDEKNLLSNF